MMHPVRRAIAATGRWLRRWQNWLTGFALLAAIAAGCRLWPHPPLREAFPQSTAIHDDAGHLLRLTLASDDQYRLWTSYGDFPPNLINATLLHEDQWFWWHPGFNPWGLLRGAWVTYVEGGHPQGGSTITMQLARLLYGLDTRTPLGKLHQIALAIKLELFYSKRQILTAYLNDAPYGGNVVGAGTASRVYFDKPASNLNLPEALTLAVIPQNPSRRTNVAHHSGRPVVAPALQKARNRLYRHWLDGHPDARQWQTLFAMPLPLRDTRALPYEAPHAVDQLIQHAKRMGHPLPSRVSMTIDLPLQHLLEHQIRGYVRHRSDSGIHNAAAILVDTRDMGIKAMVGSADFFNASIDGQVNGTLAKRSPGSTLKPFIYGLGFDQGVITPATILRDVPMAFGAYVPENFDNRFMGAITASQALIRSRNVPAVWVDSHLGSPDLYGFLRQAGVHHLASREHYGLSLALGGGDITMQELARLYALFPNHGMLRPLRLRRSDPQVAGRRLLSRDASFMVKNILESNPRPGSAFGTRESNLPVYWKTGTSWAFHDAWTAGGFGFYVLVVWVGNFDSTPNPAFVGIRAAAPLFFRIHDALRSARPHLHASPDQPPTNLKRVRICLATGMLPSRWCPQQGETWFIPGVSPIRIGHVYRPVVINDATSRPACPPYTGKNTHTEIFQYWPSDLAAVFAKAGMPLKTPPHNPDCPAAGAPNLEPPRITSPRTGVTYTIRPNHPDGNRITFTATDDASVQILYWFVDGAYIGHTQPGASLAWRPSRIGSHRIHVVNDRGNSDSRTLTIRRAE